MNPISMQQVKDLLSELIRIPSINPSLSNNPIHNEMEIAKFIHQWLTDRKIKSKIELVQPNRPNVYAEIGDNPGPTLCLCAHIDTVDVSEMTIPPYEPAIEANKMFGRGSCDMKAGAAAVLLAAEALSKQSFKGKLILALVCDEEYGSIGAEDYVKRHPADACILTEPSDLKLIIAHKGFLLGKVAVHGKAAHGSRWDLGESAITKMGPLLTALDTFDKTTLRARKDPLVGPASMHVGLISGGTGISTYASECTIHIERRTLPSEDLSKVQSELDTLILSTIPSASISWYMSRPPFSIDPSEPIVQAVSKGYTSLCSSTPTFLGGGFWTDAAIFKQAGIPTINIGPFGYGLHEPIESVDLPSTLITAQTLVESANHFFIFNDH